MITVSAELKKFFFDRKIVKRSVDAAKRIAMSKAGAFIRQRARTSLRRRKKTAAPGQPPSIHSKSAASLKKILFGWQPENESVVIGPVKLNVKGQDVPPLMEFGGTAVVVERRRSHRGEVQKTRRVAKYAAHPFMGPALQAEVEAGTVSRAWAGAVKGN